MQPNHYDLLSYGHDGTPETRASIQMTQDRYQMARDSRTGSRNQSGAFPMRPEDSWIEVSSQPSSSSLSSATNDEIITTGLRVERQASDSQHFRSRRKRVQRFAAATSTQVSYSSRDPSAASSSQDEYEESESESDRVLSSSNEDIITRSRGDALLLRTRSASEATSSSDDDDRETALGLRISASPFVPQPNVFSHPPASQTYHSTMRSSNRSQPSHSVVSNCSQSTAVRHNSNSTIRTARREQRQQHSPYNIISPSYQADHDAALRASLSTLLSCAAAARGLPKNDSPPAPAGPSTAQPSSFRLVSESVAMGEESSEAEDGPTRSKTTSPSSAPHRLSRQHKPARSDASGTASKSKRRATSSKDRSSSHPSTSKKSRHSSLADSMSAVSPTLMTWVISAGVVVLFSAISFSAGYALGREVGRTEASAAGEMPSKVGSIACGGVHPTRG
ncbi:hypothetical protein VTN77DRAFT_8413 [Rasamsonia byssochlamydoides]|uniref:uncharacterized protein n=1 Tax=Rasamsonia byssochlamydoides TaxID=89139 RepID=UPI003743C7EE